MAKKFRTADVAGATGKKHSQSKSPHHASNSATKKQDMIILPAIEATPAIQKTPVPGKNSEAGKKAVPPCTPHKRSKDAADKQTLQQRPARPKNSAKKQHRIAPKDPLGSADDFLPEYRSQTNGLRELLSTIDPLDHAYAPQGTPFEHYPTETAMHIPHSRPGIPVSPDLPIGPTRWGLYFSGALGTLAVLFVSALVFSHVTSPTGIDWAKAQTKAGETYSWIAAALSAKPASQYAQRETLTSDPLARMAGLNETQVATASRISTTAASPQQGSLKAPSAKDIFMTPQELENQIRAFEKKADRNQGHLFAARKSPNAKTRAKANPQATPREFEQLEVMPAANIDPDMENQIFKRANSYLKQRDISSARMILQYAATLGSGMSAMALAETFDPNYLKNANLHDVHSSRTDARKWYNMAARLGITEANTRLTNLR